MATKDELVAKAAELGLTVRRYDGGDGEPRVEDYERAIAEHEAGIPQPAQGPSAGSRTFMAEGPFRIFDTPRGKTITGEVKVHDDTGDEILVVGGEWALLKPLLDAGWLVEGKG